MFAARAPRFTSVQLGPALGFIVFTLGAGCGTATVEPVDDTADAAAGEPAADADLRDAPPVIDADDDHEPLPAFSSYFTRPEPGETDLVLEDLVIQLLADAPEGATVRAAYYTFSRGRMAEAFVAAYERGVDLHLILDGGNTYNAINTLRAGLGDRLTLCDDGGCVGDGIQHNKFILFSELGDGSRDVVLQSSANLTNPQIRQFNNAVVIRGDTTLYEAYGDYWDDLHGQTLDLDYYRSTVGDLRTKVYFFPRASGDTIVNVLNNVHCDIGANVYVAMAYFTNPRVAIAETLAEMDAKGCGVHVVVREESVSASVLAALSSGTVDLAMFAKDAELKTHSKYLIIDGAYGQNASHQKLVWTGSHNYTGPALRRHDEALLKIRQDEVFDAFVDDWQHTRSHAPTLHP